MIEQKRYVNRENSTLIFTIDDMEQTCKVDTSTMSFIRVTEKNNDPLYKKENSHREIDIQMIDPPGGPLIFLQMDLNDILLTGRHASSFSDPAMKPFLEADHRKIVTKIEMKPGEITINYEKKLIKKDSKTIK